MSAGYGRVDYSRLTRLSFAFGIGLFLVGELGVFGTRTAGLSLPSWELQLLETVPWVGILVALLSPFVFGIFLPLTE
ncbi:hypothetical protein ABNG03_07370 [Halorubrum sp. RMP-47]|uniref:Uncharacterized protein n=1 Tax=Halorubrum miltondacostae TaxID=3076378 RepID=A0ABD5M007_9EURY